MRDRLIETEGNAAYLILYTGDRELLTARFLTAFAHFGIPFRVKQTEAGCNWASEFERCSGVLLADCGTMMSLGEQGRRDLDAALSLDLGLVSYDTGFSAMDAAALKILGVDNCLADTSVSQVHTVDIVHPVTRERRLGEIVGLDRAMKIPLIESRHSVLLASENGSPLCLARQDRKVVTFGVSGEVWSPDVCGHCAMLDDLFFRSLVWTARKPFVTCRLPNMVSAIVDDCSGSYNHFGYVDTMNRYGWTPHLSLFFGCVDEVAHEDLGLGGKKIKSLYEDRLAEFGPHAIRYNELFGFDHLGRCVLSEKQLEENFALHDGKIRDWDIRPSRLAHMHFGEAGTNCLPYLRERGYEFFTRLLPLDASWFDVPGKIPHLKPQWPYKHDSYFLSEMPEDGHFFQPLAVAGNKTRESTDFPVHADYLWDRTCFWNENDGIDIEGAVDTVVLQIRQALGSGFYGMAATHEQRIAVMHPGEWEELWAGVADRLSGCDLRFCLLEDAMAAARDLFHSMVSGLNRSDGKLECTLAGAAENPVELQVYRDDKIETVESRLTDSFRGKIQVGL